MNELPDRRSAARADGDEERARGALARIALGGTNGNGSGDEGEINVTLTASFDTIYADLLNEYDCHEREREND